MSDALMERAARLHQAGQLGEAERLYEELLRGDPDHFAALFSLGTLYAQAGRFDQAEGEALKRNPGFADGWCMRGVLLFRLGRREEALSSLDQALALKPITTKLWRRTPRLWGSWDGRKRRSHIRNLFDEFSMNCDAKMLDTLGYRDHLHLRELAMRVSPRATPRHRPLAPDD